MLMWTNHTNWSAGLQSDDIDSEEADKADESARAAYGQLFVDALAHKVTEIHLDPLHGGTLVRFRGPGGQLHEKQRLQIPHAAFMARFKVNVGLDCTVRHLAQTIEPSLQRQGYVITEVATLPTPRGERAVMRLQIDSMQAPTVAELGAGEIVVAALRSGLAAQSGLVLVGCPVRDRNAVLRSVIREIGALKRLVVFVTDSRALPNEEGLVVHHVNRQAGFGSTMRLLAHHSADLVVIDLSMNDEEIAHAMALAERGVPVVAWLPFASPAEGLAYLEAHGISRNSIADNLNLVMTVNCRTRLCTQCKIRVTDVWQAYGCEHCLDGRSGVIGFFRILPITDPLRTHLREGAFGHVDMFDIVERASGLHSESMQSLFESGVIESPTQR